MESYLKNYFSTGFQIFSRLPKIRDYKRVNTYLINVHQASDFETMIRELSKCIYDIFNHEFFALAVKVSGKMMVWVEPSVFRETIISVIEKDFSFKGEPFIHPLNISKTGFLEGRKLNGELFGKEFSGKNFQAKLYILPGRKNTSDYHSDILMNIVAGLKNSLSKHISINQLKNAASTDPLTGCYNRREFEKRLEEQFALCTRNNSDFSLVMFDIDHFKSINDNYGHQAGDEILAEMCNKVKMMIRTEDNLFRYGGEEFVLILPDADSWKACLMAERLREEISSSLFPTNEGPVAVTASFGVSSFKDGDSPEKILKKADMMLYNAKGSGRNQVMSGIVRVLRKAGY